MPRLCSIRFDCVGHRDAYLDGVVLPLAAPDGTPMDSLLWLRNGGGKSSILTLVFSLLRPNRREFLGKDAEVRARLLEDYVAEQETGVVTLEWELDTPKGEAPVHLITGAVMEWVQRPDRKELRRQYFALQLDKRIDVTIETLPFKRQEDGKRHALKMAAIREALEGLARKAPERLQFADTQTQWEDLLTSFRIDPEVFTYQLKMNQREGGAEELFRFSSAGQFVDFIIEMVLPVETAQDASANLQRLRANVRKRPGLLLQRQALDRVSGPLAEMTVLAGERAAALAELMTAAGGLALLRGNLEATQVRQNTREAELELEVTIQSRAYSDASQGRVQAGYRMRAFRNQQQIRAHEDARLRLEECGEARAQARRKRDVLALAVRWDDVVKTRREAEAVRAERDRKLEEHRPLRMQWEDAAATLVASLDQSLARMAAQEAAVQAERKRLDGIRTACDAAMATSQSHVASWNTERRGLTETLAALKKERSRLEAAGSLLADEIPTTAVARLRTEEGRCQSQMEGARRQIEGLQEAIRVRELEIRKAAELRATAASDARHATATLEDAKKKWATLGGDSDLAELLEGETPAFPEMAAAVQQRLADMLRLAEERLTAVETQWQLGQRARHHLEHHGLLPPSTDSELVRDALRQEGIAVHAGLEYLSSNVPPERIPALIEAHPQLANGLVIPEKEMAHAAQVLAGLPLHTDGAVAIGSTTQFMKDGERSVVVVPKRAAFDRDAAKPELDAIQRQHALWETETARLRDRRTTVGRFSGALSALLRDHGPVWTEAASRRAKQLAQEAQAAAEREVWLTTQRDEDRASLLGEQNTMTSGQRALHAAEKHRTACEAFLHHGGDSLDEKAQRIEQLTADIGQEEQRRVQWEAQRRDVVRDMDSAGVRLIALATESSPLQKERTEVRSLAGTSQGVSGVELDEARNRHTRARQEYERISGNDRLTGQLDELNRRAADEERGVRAKCLTLGIGFDAVSVACLGAAASGTVQEAADAAALADDEAGSRWQEAAAQEKGLAAARRIAEDDHVRFRGQHAGPADELMKECELWDVITCAERAAEAEQRSEQYRAAEADAERRRSEAKAQVEQVKRGLAELDQWMKRAEAALTPVADVPQIKAEMLKPYAKEILPSTSDVEARLSSLVADLLRANAKKQDVQFRAETLSKKLASLVRQPDQMPLPEGLRASIDEADLLVLLGRVAALAKDTALRARLIGDEILAIDEDRVLLARQLNSVADPAMHALNSLERHSQLPSHVAVWGGSSFIKVTLRAPKSAKEREAVAANLVDKIVEEEAVPRGLELVQRMVRELTQGGMDVKMLKPEVFRRVMYEPVERMASFSGGEKLTASILLYCTLARMRARNRGRQHAPTGVLFLDNPIGTCSKPEFIELQMDMARALDMQLIYTTGVEDMQALAYLPNRVRILNEHKDVRGRMRVKVDERTMDVARIARVEGKAE